MGYINRIAGNCLKKINPEYADREIIARRIKREYAGKKIIICGSGIEAEKLDKKLQKMKVFP